MLAKEDFSPDRIMLRKIKRAEQDARRDMNRTSDIEADDADDVDDVGGGSDINSARTAQPHIKASPGSSRKLRIKSGTPAVKGRRSSGLR